MNFAEIMRLKGQEAGLSFTDRQLEQFSIYYELLVETNKVMNLTAITEPEEVAVKHMIDSLLAFDEKLFTEKTLADVGTGAGFPGIPLKIYCPSLKVTLIDSLAKRLKFLETVIDGLGLKGIRCVHLRAEDAGRDPQHREKYDLVTARAVARLSVLAEYCLPLVKTGGSFIEIPDRREAIRYSILQAQPGDMVAVIGKGHEDYQEINGVRHHFLDREVVEEAVKEIR